jgi:hypothetical protein
MKNRQLDPAPDASHNQESNGLSTKELGGLGLVISLLELHALSLSFLNFR